MFLENKGNHGVHKYFGDLVMLLKYMCSVCNRAEILKVANYSKCHVIKFEISSFYEHEYMLKRVIVLLRLV